MPLLVIAVDRPEVSPMPMSERFRTQVAYFKTPAGEPGVPPLAEGEHWVPLSKSREWLDAGVLELVSPLDSQNTTEVEISEEQEAWLVWMTTHSVERIRFQVSPGK